MDGMSPPSNRTGFRRDTTTTGHRPGSRMRAAVTLPFLALSSVWGCNSGKNVVIVLDDQWAVKQARSRGLDPFDCREPGRCPVVVVSRLNPVRLDGGDIPSIAGVERRSQLFLTDGMRASIGTMVTEAQHIQGSIVFGHRR